MALALATAYGLVAVLAMIPTWLEQRARGVDGVVQRVAGMAACILWPLTLAAVMIAARRSDRGGPTVPPD